jgi:hypothetical protein
LQPLKFPFFSLSLLITLYVDALHLPPLPTSSLYETQISPLVSKAMQGFNSTIFAYGQTGSGKTHTMSGTEDEVGVIPLAIAGVFEEIENVRGISPFFLVLFFGGGDRADFSWVGRGYRIRLDIIY